MSDVHPSQHDDHDTMDADMAPTRQDEALETQAEVGGDPAETPAGEMDDDEDEDDAEA